MVGMYVTGTTDADAGAVIVPSQLLPAALDVRSLSFGIVLVTMLLLLSTTPIMFATDEGPMITVAELAGPSTGTTVMPDGPERTGEPTRTGGGPGGGRGGGGG